ncbi:WXG100 family type VII secretion target [Saccharothrix obliqua]|uniref:WXG100 family type VII secretion target n=1 Tax=Saccharothrix obliqua TaxID=2861747 RepID=UPI001C5FE0B4|nr:WXG100 family type VII secretion target [Saccharothrix obliqua]MBW4716078.1 WXG100 family type VII secretion target [Saccharothrix obliqua]
MTGGFQVDVPGLRRGGARFSGAGDALDGVLRQLDSALRAEGRCWGDDESGQAFAGGYVPASTATLDAFRRLAGALQDIRTGVDRSADTYEGVDRDNATGLSRTR